MLSESVSMKHQCTYCDKSFARKDSRERHVLSFHRCPHLSKVLKKISKEKWLFLFNFSYSSLAPGPLFIFLQVRDTCRNQYDNQFACDVCGELCTSYRNDSCQLVVINVLRSFDFLFLILNYSKTWAISPSKNMLNSFGWLVTRRLNSGRNMNLMVPNFNSVNVLHSFKGEFIPFWSLQAFDNIH